MTEKPSKKSVGVYGALLGLVAFFFFTDMFYINIRSGIDPYLDAWRMPHLVLLSGAALAALFVSIRLLLGSFGPLRGALLLGILSFYQGLTGYHYVTKTPFDFSVMAYNADIAFNTESLVIIYESIGELPLLFLAGYILLVSFWRPLRAAFFRSEPVAWRSLGSGSAAICLYLALTASGLAPHDELGQFLRSIVTFHRNADQYRFAEQYPAGTYPFVVTEAAPTTPARTPHIFLIEIESFNPRFIEKKSAAGQEIMPVFSGLIPQGLYVDHFYGNTVQSSKGQFATLFSLLPSIRQKEFIRHANNHFLSLAALLRDNGYTSWFVKAYKNVTFDNTGVFALKNGFDRAFSIHEVLKEGDTAHSWGWGIEDQLFYRRFFEHLDTRDEIVSRKKPLFVLLHTVMNHMKFNKTPQELRHIYPDPQDMAENFANTIHLSDQHLTIFFEEMKKRDYLKDSIVIITGDHGFTTAEHGYEHNELYYYEEFFRTPFLLIYPGVVAPQRIADIAYSQIDIAPTILDIIGLTPAKHHFRGQSMLHPKEPGRPVLLIQPYNGTFLGVVDYPMKYVRHVRTGEEFVYDLERDPQETDNIVATTDPSLIDRWRGLLRDIYLNQYLLETNQVWLK
ncbi:MAG TPA: sulfatase-like hydrolase/transferase [bacterium]|nr:sulfatase-like hydrolase/transferase [bacterium]